MAALTLDLAGHTFAEALRNDAARLSLEQQLPAFMLEQRWFGGRAHGIDAVRIEHFLPMGDGSLVLLIVRVTDNHGALTRYQLPLQADAAGALRDPLLDGSAARFRDILLAGDTIEGDGIRYVPTVLAASSACVGDPRPLGAEQSNTSVVFGRECMLKVFRMLQDGPNPDVQLVSWLSQHGGFPGVPRVLGSARIETTDFTADAAVMQEFLPNDGDGWEWVLRRARAAFAAAPDAPVMQAYLREERATLAEAAAIGTLTAQLHASLAGATGEGMQPEPFEADDWRAWSDAFRHEVRATAGMLAAEHPGVAARLNDLADAETPPLPAALGLKTRVHGDYHLGQLLHTPRGWVVLDFEGEPSRPISERIALQHPLVDVAGMLRSWDYAAHVAGEGSPATLSWRDAVSERFLQAYQDEASGAQPVFLPSGSAERDRLLRLFSLRKALYEVRYELGSRPDWVSTPLAAVAAMLDRKT